MGESTACCAPCIRAGGDPRRAPATFEELVDPGRVVIRIQTRDPGGPDKAGRRVQVAKTLVASALDSFHEPNLGTFSPEDAVGLHTHFGACAVRGISAGRPRHAPPHVVVMCYRGFERRERPATGF